MLLTEELSESLIRAGLSRIIFSFDDMEPEVFNKIRVGSDYDKVLSNIKTFIGVSMKLGSRNTHMVVGALKIPAAGDKLHLDMKPKMSHNFVRHFKGLPVVIWPNWAHNWASDFVAGAAGMAGGEPIKSYYPCSLLWGEISIRWDGTVIPCCYDLSNEQPMGKFPEKSLDGIWNGDEYMRLRQSHISGKLPEAPLCLGCSSLQHTSKLDRLFGDEAEKYKKILSS